MIENEPLVDQPVIVRRLLQAGLALFLAQEAAQARELMTPIETVEAAKNLPAIEAGLDAQRWWMSLPLRVVPLSLRLILLAIPLREVSYPEA